MKAGGRGRDGSALTGIDSLVAVAIVGCVISRDVGREGDVADALDGREEVICGMDSRWRLFPHEPDVAFAEFSARDDFGFQFIVIAEIEMFAETDLSSGSYQAFPIVGIMAELVCQENFNASTEKLARGGVVRAERLRLK